MPEKSWTDWNGQTNSVTSRRTKRLKKINEEWVFLDQVATTSHLVMIIKSKYKVIFCKIF
jgi:hypothetical protein